jgi:hypothetical protein
MNKQILLAAALTGMVMGAATVAHAEDKPSKDGIAKDGSKHACKGQNACKGQGGCKSETHACKGQNACKGQGGCKG